MPSRKSHLDCFGTRFPFVGTTCYILGRYPIFDNIDLGVYLYPLAFLVLPPQNKTAGAQGNRRMRTTAGARSKATTKEKYKKDNNHNKQQTTTNMKNQQPSLPYNLHAVIYQPWPNAHLQDVVRALVCWGTCWFSFYRANRFIKCA